MDMIFTMTSSTSNSIESLLRLPFHIFLYQYKEEEKLLKEKAKVPKLEIPRMR